MIDMSEDKVNFELYKLYVEQAEKVSAKRASANNYLLTVNTFLLSLYSISTNFDVLSKSLWNYFVPAAGILICITWCNLIKSYRNLNSAKFKVIHEMELGMEFQPFKKEWEYAEKGIGNSYKQITKIEPYIPFIFFILYAIAAICAFF